MKHGIHSHYPIMTLSEIRYLMMIVGRIHLAAIATRGEVMWILLVLVLGRVTLRYHGRAFKMYRVVVLVGLLSMLLIGHLHRGQRVKK